MKTLLMDVGGTSWNEDYLKKRMPGRQAASAIMGDVKKLLAIDLRLDWGMMICLCC
jgi:hypothetical protein